MRYDRYAEVGLLCQRGAVMSLMLSPFAFIFWFNAKAVLVAVGQPHEVAVLSQQFLRIYCLALPAVVLFESLRRFLLAQNVIFPIVCVAGVVGCVLHPIFLVVCVHLFGFNGVPTAVVLSQWAQALLTLAYVRRPGTYRPETWAGFDLRNACQGREMLHFLRLAGPAVLSMSEVRRLGWGLVRSPRARYGNTKQNIAHSRSGGSGSCVRLWPASLARRRWPRTASRTRSSR